MGESIPKYYSQEYFRKRFGETKFLDIYNHWDFDKQFKEYQTEFLNRCEESTDEKLLLQLELKRFEFDDHPYYQKGNINYKTIGYLIAVNGQNPLVSDLLSNKGDYIFTDYFNYFEDDPVAKNNNKEIIERLEKIVQYLPKVCEGYLDAKKVEFLRGKEREINDPDFENRTESLPEYQFKTINQKIAWLHELEILEPILQKANDNYYIAANIIHSFTDLKPETIRKGLEAIYKPNEKNKKNNPLNNPDNRLFINEMKRKFKLDKERQG